MIKWFTGLFQSTDSRVPIEKAYVGDPPKKPLNKTTGSYNLTQPVPPIYWEQEQEIIRSTGKISIVTSETGYRVSPYDAHYIPPPIDNHPFISVPVMFTEAIPTVECYYTVHKIGNDTPKDNSFQPDHYETFNSINNEPAPTVDNILNGEASIIMKQS